VRIALHRVVLKLALFSRERDPASECVSQLVRHAATLCAAVAGEPDSAFHDIVQPFHEAARKESLRMIWNGCLRVSPSAHFAG
jgi:hypothetical protein